MSSPSAPSLGSVSGVVGRDSSAVPGEPRDALLDGVFGALKNPGASKADVEQSCIALYCHTASGSSASLQRELSDGGLVQLGQVLSTRSGDVEVRCEPWCREGTHPPYRSLIAIASPHLPGPH